MRYHYKRPPFDMYDAVAMESWLSDMAKKGYIFERNNLIYFCFAKSKPLDIDYRVEPILGKVREPSEEILIAYADAGWEFITRQGDFFIWKSSRANATELHTDPIVQSESYRSLCKKLTFSAITTGICVVAIFAMILGGLLVSNKPVTLFLSSPILLLLAISELFVLSMVIGQARSALRIKKVLAEGIPLNHKQDYRNRNHGYRIINVLSMLLSIAVVAISILSITSDWRKNIVDLKTPLPFLSLDLIEQSEEFTWAEPVYINDGVDYTNYADYTWTILVPEYYEIHQEGAPQSHKWADGSGYYTPSATTEYYRLTFSIFAPTLLEELMQTVLWKDEEYTIHELDAFDRTVLAVNERYHMNYLFVQWDNQVIYIRYQGYADLQQRLDLLANALALKT